MRGRSIQLPNRRKFSTCSENWPHISHWWRIIKIINSLLFPKISNPNTMRRKSKYFYFAKNWRTAMQTISIWRNMFPNTSIPSLLESLTGNQKLLLKKVTFSLNIEIDAYIGKLLKSKAQYQQYAKTLKKGSNKKNI